MGWMHPPVHRILGWVSRPSSLKLSREVWRLDQFCGFSEKQVFVRGEPAVTNQETLERLPTLINAHVLDINGLKLGIIADFLFDLKLGNISSYLISRSDPRLPGTSRWKISIDKIVGQRPGVVLTRLNSLDDLPIERSSIRNDLLNRTNYLRNNLRKIGMEAGGRFNEWLDDSVDDQYIDSRSKSDPLDEWDDETFQNKSRENFEDISVHQHIDKDPWI